MTFLNGILEIAVNFIYKFVDGLKISNPVAQLFIVGIIGTASAYVAFEAARTGSETLATIAGALTVLNGLLNSRTSEGLNKIKAKEVNKLASEK